MQPRYGIDILNCHDIVSWFFLLSQFDELVNVFHNPLAALGVKDFVVLTKIVKHMILIQLVHSLSAGQFFFILVLLDAERNEIGNILCSLVHNTLFEDKDNANFANSTNYANYFYRIIREISMTCPEIGLQNCKQ